MFIEALISLKSKLFRVTWSGRGDGQPTIHGAPIAVEALRLLEEA